jgi:hypothetical protein
MRTFGGLILCLVLLQFGLETSKAKLGETLNACITRYGAPLKEVPDSSGIGDSIREFKNGDYVLYVIFQKGKSVSESYQRSDGAGLTEKEQENLLESEAQGKIWTDYPGLELKAWSRDDGPIAFLDQSSGQIVFAEWSYFTALGKRGKGK